MEKKYTTQFRYCSLNVHTPQISIQTNRVLRRVVERVSACVQNSGWFAVVRHISVLVAESHRASTKVRLRRAAAPARSNHVLFSLCPSGDHTASTVCAHGVHVDRRQP